METKKTTPEKPFVPKASEPCQNIDISNSPHVLFWNDKSLQTPTPVRSFSPASEATRSPHGNKMSQNYYLRPFVRFRHTNKELMKDSHKKEKGDIGLDQKELARGGTTL